MRPTIRDWLEQAAPDRADLLALAVALVGCLVATGVALRVPLLGGWDGGDVTAGPGEGGAAAVAPADVDGGAAPGTPSAGSVLVHVAGAVASPGVVQLPVGARVADAIEAVGGPRPDARLDALNLARVLADGEQVVVPGPVTDAGTDGTAGPAGADTAGTAGTAGAVLPDGRLDLNAASAAELEELPGVGPVLASRIVAHRDEHGPFTRAAQLLDVNGIGEATWATLRDLVGVR